jgi:antitoxin (DNA-binding transcriptional repressor) of toxin-antitoxin stability system
MALTESWVSIGLSLAGESIGNLRIIASMADRGVRISESDAANNFALLLARVRAGAEIVIEHDAEPVAILHAPSPPRRTISECVALLSEESNARVTPILPGMLKRLPFTFGPDT